MSLMKSWHRRLSGGFSNQAVNIHDSIPVGMHSIWIGPERDIGYLGGDKREELSELRQDFK